MSGILRHDRKCTKGFQPITMGAGMTENSIEKS